MLLLGSVLYISTLCAQCGPAVDPSTTQAIISVESGGNPYVIGDNTLKKSFSPKTRTEAIALASQLVAQGHNIDMGLMQINSCHIRPRRLTLEQIFDPCQNIRIGTTILAEFYQRFDNGEPAGLVLYKALSGYNTGSAWRGPGYINKILKAAGVNYRVAVTGVPPQSERKGTISTSKSSRMQAANSSLFFGDNSQELAGGGL